MSWFQANVKGQTPQARSFHTATFANANGKQRLYVIGGRSPGLLGDVWYLELSDVDSGKGWESRQHRWYRVEPKGEFFEPRSRHTACFFENKIYVFGGIPRDATVRTNEIMALTLSENASEHSWSKVRATGQKPESRFQHCAAIDDGYLYVYGGTLNTAGQEMGLVHLSDLYRFDLRVGMGQGTWTKIVMLGANSELPKCNYTCVAPSVGKMFFVGYTPPPGRQQVKVYRLNEDEESGEFSWIEPSIHGSGSDKPSPRTHYALTYVPSAKRGSTDGYALLVGGMTAKGLSNEIYQMRAGSTISWKLMVQHGQIPEPRQGHSATYVEWPEEMPQTKDAGKNGESESGGSVHQFVYVFGGAPEDKDVSFDHVYVLDLEVRMEWEKIMPALSDRIDCKLCRMGHTMTTITTRWSPEYESAKRRFSTAAKSSARQRAKERMRLYRSEKILILGGDTNGPWTGSKPSALQHHTLLLCYRRRGNKGGSWEWHDAGSSKGPIINSDTRHNPLSHKAEPFAMAANDKVKGTAEDAKQLSTLAEGGLISHTAEYFEGNEQESFKCVIVFGGGRKVGARTKISGSMYMLDMLADEKDKKRKGYKWKWYEIKLPFEGYQKSPGRPAPRLGHASARWNDKLYIFGGFGEVPDGNDLPQMGYFQDAWVFDVGALKSHASNQNKEHKWELLPPPMGQSMDDLQTPSYRIGHTATTVGDSIYIFGGSVNGQPCPNDMFEYNCRTSEWTAYPGGDSFFSGTARGGAGGRAASAALGHVRTSSAVRNLTKANRALSFTGGSAPCSRYGHTAVHAGSKIFVYGGVTTDTESSSVSSSRSSRRRRKTKALTDLWVFDTSTNQWTFPDAQPKLLKPRFRHAACALRDRKYADRLRYLVVFGGAYGDGNESDEAAVFKLDIDFDHFNTDTEDTVDSRSATKMTDGSEGSRRDGDSVEASEYDRGFKGGPPTSEEKIHH